MSLEERTNTNVTIELQNPNHQQYGGENVYMAGETIAGRLTVFCPSPITIRGILVRLTGEAKCQFIEVEGERNMTHVGDETYLQKDLYLLGNDSGTLRLEAGTSFYSFEHQLPSFLPMSMTCKFGQIRYWISGILNRPKRFDTKIDLNLRIKSDLDLNQFPLLKAPAESDWTQHYYYFGCCICLKTNNMFMAVQVPRAGYVAGNTIAVNLRIENQSTHPIQSFSVKLIELMTCHPYPVTADSYESTETTIAEEVIAGCAGIETDERRINIRVPSGTDFRPSDVQSNVLKLKHAIKVTGRAGRLHFDPVVYVQIRLGTVDWLRRESNVSDIGTDLENMFAAAAATTTRPKDDNNNHSAAADAAPQSTDNQYQTEYNDWNA